MALDVCRSVSETREIGRYGARKEERKERSMIIPRPTSGISEKMFTAKMAWVDTCLAGFVIIQRNVCPSPPTAGRVYAISMFNHKPWLTCL